MTAPLPVNKFLVGLTDHARAIADELQDEYGCKSLSETIEWLVLCQRYDKGTAQALFSRRRQRGQRGPVIVVPDDCELPPEG